MPEFATMQTAAKSDQPITGLCIVSDPTKCPPGYDLVLFFLLLLPNYRQQICSIVSNVHRMYEATKCFSKYLNRCMSLFNAQIYRSYDKKDDCDLWKDSWLRSRVTRYLCLSRVFPLDGVSSY